MLPAKPHLLQLSSTAGNARLLLGRARSWDYCIRLTTEKLPWLASRGSRQQGATSTPLSGAFLALQYSSLCVVLFGADMRVTGGQHERLQ